MRDADQRRMCSAVRQRFGPIKKAEATGPNLRPSYSYTLKDFDSRPVDANSALVTYMADYSGKFAGELLQAKSAYGEVCMKQGNEWKLLDVEETK